jgi:hypothetical protein
MLSHSNIPHAIGDPNHSAHARIDARVIALGIAHDDLDAAIDALAATNAHDDLVLARLKKQRLQIRDEIAVMLGSAFAGDGAHG